MKLYDLIKTNNWLSIELTMLRLYSNQENMLDEYRNVFEKLKMLIPEDYDMSIVLTEYDSDSDFESEKKTYVDVSGRKNEYDPNALSDSYALEFVDWKKWLGMDIAPETKMNFSELEIITHCLIEMTFISYNEKEIKEQFDSLTDKVEDYKNLTEEEKMEKTINLDELKRRIDEKGSS
jgi:hypothetical protein